MSEQTRNLVASIRARLDAIRRRMTALEIAAGLLLTAGILATIWIVLISLEAGFWLSSPLRLVLVSVAGFGITVLLVLYVGRPLAKYAGWYKPFTERSVAKEISKRYPEISDRLVNLLELSEGAHSQAPEPLLDRAVRELGQEIEPVSFEGVASTEQALRAGKLALIPIAIGAVLFLIGPRLFADASARILSPGTEFLAPSPFSIRVSPGDAEIVRGDSITVSAYLDGADSDVEPTIVFVYEGEVRTRSERMEKNDQGLYKYPFASLRESLTYRIEALSVVSEEFAISVVERPLIERLDVVLDYPAYSRLPSQQLDSNVGDISALVGTRASIHLSLGGAAVERGNLVLSKGEKLALKLDDDRASISFPILRDVNYWIELASSDGVANADPIEYEIRVVSDEAPSISFVYPDPQSELDEKAVLPFGIRFTDDFGFSSLHLFTRLAESRFDSPDEEFSATQLDIEEPFLLDQMLEHPWDLSRDSGLDPVPGDVIEYFIRVFDNDRISGAKPADTPTYTARFPSLAERYEQLNEAEDETESELEELVEEARDIRDQFETLKEDLREKHDADWQDERRLEQLQDRQQELESSVEDISENIQDFIEEMSQNDLVSDETVNMFEELREVVDEVNSPELMEALRNLEDSIEQLDLSQMQQSLEDFEFNEQMYNERLERALELFKNLRLQQNLEEAENRAENLMELEDQIEEETAKLENEEERKRGVNPDDENRRPDDQKPRNEDADRLAAEQDRAAKEMEALEEKLQEIRERMEELNSAPTEAMQDLEEDTLDRELPKQMQQNAEDIREQNFDQAQSDQQQMQEQLGQIQGQLGEMQQNMAGQQLQVNTAGLRAALEDILTLSEKQELLRLDVATKRAESPRLRESAQDQVELSEGLVTVADSLQQLARKIPQMSRDVQQQSGDALREMGSAVAALTDRSSRRATGHQKGAMTHLNELALILSELLNQMMSGQASSGSGMSMEQLMEQLQNMGEQQQQLNQQIQQMLNDQQGNRLTSDVVERMRQLGSQQDQIRRDLKQINRDRAARNKLLGDLNRIAEQMEESVRELMQSRTSRQIMQRQQQILTRLLEASRSLQEKGKERQRESRTGADPLRESPDELPPSEQIEALRRDLFRALESGYAQDFEQLIRRYFELLQRRAGE